MVVVIGIGQVMRGDDAAGLEAVRRWAEMCADTANSPEVRVELAGLAGLGLLDLLTGASAALLVDAVRGSDAAGTIHRITPDELAAFSTGASSAHGWSVAETLSLWRQLQPAEADLKIRIIGIEAGQVDMGAGLSDEIIAAMPGICSAIEEEVQALVG